MDRRTTLAGMLGGAVTAGFTATGCGLLSSEPPPPHPLSGTLRTSRTLAQRYQAVISAHPGLAKRLTPLAADHRTHAAELARVINRPLPSGAPASGVPGGDAAESVATLRKAEQTAQKTAAAACRTAPADRAGLTGSIAAARAAHAEALR